MTEKTTVDLDLPDRFWKSRAEKAEAEIDRLHAVNADLLDALKAAHAYLENAGPVVLVEQMKTAIAKASSADQQPVKR